MEYDFEATLLSFYYCVRLSMSFNRGALIGHVGNPDSIQIYGGSALHGRGTARFGWGE